MSSGTTSPAAARSPLLRLRSDVRVTAGEDGGFVLEDPRQGKFYRLGAAEYLVVAQLDGQTDLRTAVARASDCRGSQLRTAERSAKLYSWLLASGLLEVDIAHGASSSNTSQASPPSFNPCYFRYSLGDPARLLSRCERVLGWAFALPVVIAVVLISLAAAVLVFQQWEKLTASLSGILCPDQHLALFGCWLVLKTAHEIGHGVACRRFGGDVGEWGLAFIYFMPVPYTDVTSSWRLGSRCDRISVAAAGMYVEWILALLALLAWSWSSSPAVQHLCVYTISLATVSTVLFNANPLCRLDGYYIMSDLLRWPNFSSQAQRVVRSLFQRLVFGIKATGEADLARGQYWILLVYGLAAAIWRWLALLSMAAIGLIAYEGLGALLITGALVVTYFPYRSPLGSNSSTQVRELLQPRPIARLSLMIGGCLLIVWFFPWSVPVTAPGIVESAAQHSVRTRAAGHVVDLCVTDGELVEAGQKLVVLQNDELAYELRNLVLAFAHGEAKLRSLHTKRQLVDYQVQQQRQETLALQIAEQRRKIESLTLTAPVAGCVLARRMSDLSGSYLKEGTEVCAIVEPGMKFRLSIAESDVPYFVKQQGQPMKIRLPHRTVTGVFASFEPQASTLLFDPSLSAAAGGPLPVAPTTTDRNRSSDSSTWQLLEPRMTGTVHLSPDEWPTLQAGQRGSVALHPQEHSVAAASIAFGRGWIHSLRQRYQSQKGTD